MKFGAAKIVFRNLAHFFWQNLFLFAVSFLACAIFGAALFSGDSLRASLSRKVENRLSKIEAYAFAQNGNSFAENIFAGEDFSAIFKTDCAVYSKSELLEANAYGIDLRYFYFSKSCVKKSLPQKDCVYLNEALAKRLNLRTGDFLTVSFPLNSYAQQESVFADNKSQIKSVRVKIEGILGVEDFGDIHFFDSQISPYNIFFSRQFLSELLVGKDCANLVLSKKKFFLENKKFRLADFNLQKEESEAGIFIKSKNFFLPSTFCELAQQNGAEFSLAWFINEVCLNGKISRFAFALGFGNSSEGEVKISDYLARELNAKVGDEIELEYFVSAQNSKLEVARAKLKISEIFSQEKSKPNAAYMPNFAGMTDAENCTQWDSSIPLDLDKIKESDKQYWREYKTLPKIIVSYSDAKKMWGCRFGNASAVHFKNPHDLQNAENLLDAKSLGLFEVQPKKSAFFNAQNGVDFGGLFVGLSFFLMLSCLVFCKLALSLNVALRHAQTKVLKLLGFENSQIFVMYFCEYFFVCVVASILGAVCAILLNHVLIFVLNGVWAGITSGAEIKASWSLQSLAISFFVIVLFFGAQIFFELRKSLLKLEKPREIYAAKVGIWNKLFPIAMLAGGLCLWLKDDLIWRIFAALSLLFGGLFLLRYIFCGVRVPQKLKGAATFTLLNIKRNFQRGFLVVISATVASFLLAIVGLNKIGGDDFTRAESGTGSYDYFVKFAFPIDIAHQKNGDNFDIDFLRVFKQSSADCLNLNRVETPQVFSVPSEVFAKKCRFSFDKFYKKDAEKSWKILEENLPNGEIPAVADASTIRWSLKKKLGDVVEYERGGKIVRLRLVASLKPSIFQGALIVSEKNFLKNWEDSSGYSIALTKGDEGLKYLEKIFAENYPIVERAGLRMQKFADLQNSYLLIFLELGLLGIALGFSSCMLLCARLIESAKQNIAFMMCQGFEQKFFARELALEYGILVSLGMFCGLLSALPLLPTSAFSAKMLLFLLPIIFTYFCVYFSVACKMGKLSKNIARTTREAA